MDHGLPLSQAWARGRENYFIFYPFSCVIRIYLSISILSLENFASHKKIENRCQRQVLRLKMYLSCDCGRGSVPDPTGGAYSAPQTPSWAGFKGSASQQMRKSRVDRAEGTTLFYQPLHLASHLKVVFWWLILFITDANKRALWLWLWGKRRKGRRWMETYGKEWRGKGWCRLCTSCKNCCAHPWIYPNGWTQLLWRVLFCVLYLFNVKQMEWLIDAGHALHTTSNGSMITGATNASRVCSVAAVLVEIRRRYE